MSDRQKLDVNITGGTFFIGLMLFVLSVRACNIDSSIARIVKSIEQQEQGK